MKLLLFFICFVATSSAAILGIDYGQQFTKAVLLAPGISFEIVLTDEGKRKDLSGISIRENDGGLERVFGSATGSLCTRFPQSCILGLKPLLGKSAKSAETHQFLGRNFGVKLVGDESRSDAIKVDLGLSNDSYKFAIEEVLAMSLHELKGRALNDLEDNALAKPIVEDVVVSVAPFASHETKQAYLDGLKLGNFSNVLGLVDEGTAVALNYVSSKKFEKEDLTNEKEYHIIYDMGAGSTTATLFSFTPFTNGSIVLELESIGYDETFGGQIFTQSVHTIILEKFLTTFNLKDSTKLPPKVLARILEVAEKAKIVLSINSDYHVSLENLYEGKDFKTTVTKDEFEEINSDLMNHITKPIKDALKSSTPEKSIEDIKSVILNGGSMRIPFVQKHIATLLGEKRISKSVNADESCALGTTLQGLKLKTKFGSAKDIKVIEKSYHNFEIKVDENDDDILVFAKGCPINNSSRLNLGTHKKSINIGLYEDGRLIKSYKFDDFLKRVSDISCSSKDNKQIFGTFTLDHNKMFDLSSLEVECVASEEKGGFFQKLLHKEGGSSEETDEEITNNDGSINKNDTNSTQSSTSKSSKRKIKAVSISIPKPIYPRIKPMSKTTKERTFNKLAYLNSRDESRAELDQIKNSLEGGCYELRAYIDDHQEELLKEMTENELSDYSTFVRDTIEWFEFDSDGSSIEDFLNKADEVASKKKDLDSIVEMSKVDISLAGMKKLYEDGTAIAMQVQSYMLESGTQISEIRQKYEKENFDFDKENDRIKFKLLREGGDKIMTLDKDLAKYKDHLAKVGELTALSESQFNKIPRREVYEKYEATTAKIVEMLADIILIQESHKSRIETFNDKFDKLLERKNKKELRDKLKQEKGTEKESIKEAVEEEEEKGFIEEESDSEPIESETKTESTANNEAESIENVHDEL